MNWSTIRRSVAVGCAIAALGMISIGVIMYGFRAPFAPEIRSAPVTVEPRSSANTEFSFTLLDEPRVFPELQFMNGEERALTLADFRGRLVLLNIWATWCIPCRREMPALDRLQAELGGPEFEVLALSIDRKGLPAVEAFYEELGLEALGMYVDSSSKASRSLAVVGIPTTLLINRSGDEVGRLVGPYEWDDPAMISFLREQITSANGP